MGFRGPLVQIPGRRSPIDQDFGDLDFMTILTCDLLHSSNVNQVYLSRREEEHETKKRYGGYGIDSQPSPDHPSSCSWGKGSSCPKANQEHRAQGAESSGWVMHTVGDTVGQTGEQSECLWSRGRFRQSRRGTEGWDWIRSTDQ